METCLECLWESLRNPVAKIINENISSGSEGAEILAKSSKLAYDSKLIIDLFYTDLQDCFGGRKGTMAMPDHVKIFRKSLEDFNEQAIRGIVEGANLASQCSSQCGLCAVCQKCSERFYMSIVNKKMEEKTLPFELENYFLAPPQMHYYEEHMAGVKEHFYLQDSLLCLKGFSSSTPTIHSATFNSGCVGGGIFLKYGGAGIVIDPGIGFVTSMHKHGIYIDDINIVIITHDHLDHNADAPVISSLLHDFNNYNKRKNRIAKEIFELERVKEHSICWIVDDMTKKKMEELVTDIEPLSSYLGDKRELSSGNFQLSAIRTEHIRDSEESYGLKLHMDNTIIGYTSDTGYFKGLSDFFVSSDVLIFNVSDIYKKDVKGLKDKNSHLGYNGSLKLLNNVNPKIAIASEFCCTNGDFRMEFIDVLSKELKNICILPGEIGLNISIPDSEIECTICRNKSNISEIKVLAPQKEYQKIQYICGKCVHHLL